MTNLTTILIVNDSEVDRLIYCRYLTDDRPDTYRILEAATLETGLELCYRESPSAILLGLRLPDGLVFLDRMKQHGYLSPLPVIVVTGQGDETIAVQAIKRGAHDYLVKNALNQLLLQRSVDNLLERMEQIAELERANQQLLKLSERLEVAIKAAKIGIWEWDIISDRLLWDDLMYKLYGIQPSSFQNVYAAWEEGIHPDDRLLCNEAIAKALRGEKEFEMEFRVVLPDGTIRNIQSHSIIHRNTQGEPVSMIGTNHDITDLIQAKESLIQAKAELAISVDERTSELVTANARLELELIERQRADTELKRQEQLFRTLAEFSPVGIFMMDSSNECTYTNPRSHEICGFTAEQALGKGWLDFIHPDDRELLLAQLMEVNKHTLPFECKIRFVHKDTSILSGNIRTSPVISSSGQLIGHVGTIEDITKAQMVEQMKDEFIAIVSHEIRTPLTGIRGALGLMATGALAAQPARAKRILEIAVADTERLVRLVGDVLDLERLESGIDKLVRAHCRIDVLIAQAAEALQSAAEQAQVSLKLYPVPFELWVDGDLIVQALINLISNAIKFSPPGGVVAVRSILRAEHVLFRVEDQGTGIPADKLESIFGRFQQVNASDSRQKGGTGLGLAICRNIIESHGGYVWAESTLGEESIFSFTLPYTHP